MRWLPEGDRIGRCAVCPRPAKGSIARSTDPVGVPGVAREYERGHLPPAVQTLPRHPAHALVVDRPRQISDLVGDHRVVGSSPAWFVSFLHRKMRHQAWGASLLAPLVHRSHRPGPAQGPADRPAQGRQPRCGRRRGPRHRPGPRPVRGLLAHRAAAGRPGRAAVAAWRRTLPRLVRHLGIDEHRLRSVRWFKDLAGA